MTRYFYLKIGGSVLKKYIAQVDWSGTEALAVSRYFCDGKFMKLK